MAYFHRNIHEGVWDLTEEARKTYDGAFDKNDLVFKLMMRQPSFVDNGFALKMLELTKKNKSHDLLEKVKFEEVAEGKCIQMLHLGSYDSEPASFSLMEQFADKTGYKRVAKTHREIYLSDARKVSADKLKTVLRFRVEKSRFL